MLVGQKWTLTQEAFDKLLIALGGDRESGSQKYLEIRNNLTRFFEWRGCEIALQLLIQDTPAARGEAIEKFQQSLTLWQGAKDQSSRLLHARPGVTPFNRKSTSYS